MDGSKTGGFRKARIHHNQFQAALDRTLHPFHRITDQKSSGRMGYQRIAAEQYGNIRIINMVTHCMPISHAARGNRLGRRSAEHTSELQSLMRISYAVFCLKKTKYKQKKQQIMR